jgi:hypothetical protein
VVDLDMNHLLEVSYGISFSDIIFADTKGPYKNVLGEHDLD